MHVSRLCAVVKALRMSIKKSKVLFRPHFYRSLTAVAGCATCNDVKGMCLCACTVGCLCVLNTVAGLAVDDLLVFAEEGRAGEVTDSLWSRPTLYSLSALDSV